MDIRILNKIKSPRDVKKLDGSELDTLCAEIRSVLIDTISKTGGHLASNLGTVELTVALHRMFDSPDDKIIWDVGHQAYTHKLLTGRYDRISSIRTSAGLSGFLRRDESEHDIFYTGHAGTSVSQAAGVAAANTIKGNKHYSVAVIGDGSFTNGMVYEALNDAGSTDDRLIVVLNDNEMSISENVGSMARYLAKVRAKPEYYRFKAGTEKAINRIPLVGKKLSNHIFKLKTALKNLIYSSSFFEDLGFRYIGPVDGHDIGLLCEAMGSAKMVNRPVLLHVNTLKGKGYDFAENAPERYHGVGEFDVVKGMQVNSGSTFSSAFGKALMGFAANDKRICAITAAMSIGTGLEPFSKAYPERFFDVGIAEEHAVTFAAGLAANGMLPVVAVYSTFLQRCCDQLIHDCALQKFKIVIAVDRAGFVGEDGETHQGLYDVAMLCAVPGVTVYSPATYEELSSALYNAFYKDSGLIIIRYPRGGQTLTDERFISEFAPFRLFGSSDAKTAVVTYGRIFASAAECCDRLSANGHDVKLLKLTRIIPIEEAVFEQLIGCDRICFFEEGIHSGSVAQRLACGLLERGCGGSIKITAVNDCFVRHACVSELMSDYSLDSDGMFRTVIEEMRKDGNVN